MKNNISERLKILRKELNISQSELAEFLGVTQTSIYRYEQGQAIPGPENFVKLADYYDVSMDYLFCRTDERKSWKAIKRDYEFTQNTANKEDFELFIEMCFDPSNPASSLLKEALIKTLHKVKEEE